jgi:hypothetical protein
MDEINVESRKLHKEELISWNYFLQGWFKFDPEYDPELLKIVSCRNGTSMYM